MLLLLLSAVSIMSMEIREVDIGRRDAGEYVGQVRMQVAVLIVG